MKNVKVHVSIVSLILVLIIIPVGLYSTSLPSVVLGQSDNDDNGKDNEDNGISNINGDGESKFVILTFDDGYKSQYTTVKPILDNYGYKGTFYVVCNYAQKEDTDRMNWNDIQDLQKQGHDIGSHSMNHADLTSIPSYRIDYEIGISKQCLESHDIKVTSFAYPFAKGSENDSIINTVAKYYTLGRTADAPLMFLDCSGWDNSNEDIEDDISLTLVSSRNDGNDSCNPYSEDDSTLNAVNRYSIMGWTHDSERYQNGYDDRQMLERFIEVVEGQSKYNNERELSTIPIIIWHNIEDNASIDAHTTTTTKLFEEEIKYLHDNGFTVLTMADLIYDERTSSLKIKEGLNTVPSMINRIDYSEAGDNDSEDNVEH